MKLINKTKVQLTESIPVYDIEVADSAHNFQLAAGNFVHNCTSALSSSYILLATLGEKHERVETMPKVLIDEYKKLGGNKDYHFIEYHKGEFFKRGFINLDEFKDAFGFDLGIDFKPSTLVAFKPDDTIFVSPKASYPANLKFVKKIAEVNNKKLEIFIEDKKFADDLPMYSNNVDSTLLTKKTDSINPYMRIVSSFRVNENWNCKDRCASVNGLQTNEGIHVTYFEKAFHNAWNRHYFEAKWTELCSIDYWVICLANEPVFDSQTKVRLKNLPGIDMKDTYALEQQIIREFKKNYQEWDLYAEKVRQNLKNVQDLGKIELIKTKVFIAAENSSRNAAKFLPKKLKDCYGKNREQCQLWVCFKGDTKITDCNGNKYSFIELTERIKNGEQIYTYSCDSNGSLFPSKIIWSGIVNKASTLIKVTLDNGESFECTPDHKILMKSGEYKSAEDLLKGDSCMPLYMSEISSPDYGGCKRRVVRCKPSKNYKFRSNYNTKNSDGTFEFFGYRIMGMHKDVIDKSSGNDVVHIYHIDGDSLNDSPLNLNKVDQTWHRSHHGGLALLRHYKSGEFNNFYGCNDAKRLAMSIAQVKSMKNPDIRLNLHNKAVKQWSNPDLRKWKSEDNKRWSKEHSIESSLRVSKAVYTRRLNLVHKVIDELMKLNLKFTFSNFNEISFKFSPKRRYRIESLLKTFPNELSNFVDENIEVEYRYCELILNKLSELKLPVTKKNFSDVNKLIYGKHIKLNTYIKYRTKFKDLFDNYEMKLNVNHKVSKIEVINYDEPIDVYCLTVDNELHNFPLGSGIFVKNCEGESAAGSLIKARDPAIHAVLPLRGRPMTTVYKDIEDVLENDEMRDFISCIGVGVKDYYNLDKVRYGKIVIATDADTDGFAIASSVLATIIDHMKFLIDNGFVYISVAPLYYQNGKYFYTNADFDKLDKNKPFTRFKGLGELSPNQLYDSMLNPKNQILIQVTSERVEETLALLTRTGARRDLMISNGIVSEEFLKYEKIKDKLK